jgi:lipoic acid synthetase
MQELPVVPKIDPTTSKIQKPNWLRVKLPIGESYKHVRGLVDTHKLHTMCVPVVADFVRWPPGVQLP